MKLDLKGIVRIGLILFTALYLPSRGIVAQEVNTIERVHDAIILKGSGLIPFLGEPVSRIRVYRYLKVFDLWEPIPFQVDELDGGTTYFGEKNGIFDENDEVVFLAKDLGDSVPIDLWIVDDEARRNSRNQIMVSDPIDPEAKGWVTVYLSSTLPLAIREYIEYFPDEDLLETDTFTIAHGASGFQEYLSLRSLAGEDAKDLIDRQKLRLKVKIDLGVLGKTEFVIKEEMNQNIEIALGVSLHVSVRLKQVDAVPGSVVRLHRRMILGAEMDAPGIGVQYDFPFTTTFYPTYMEFGVDEFEIPNIGVGDIKEVRFSTDHSENSVGMILYNPYNPEGIRIDGLLSVYNDQLDWPGRSWYLVVADPEYDGAQIRNGSILTLMDLRGNPIGDAHRFFFQDLALWSSSGDTGDKKSYGDTGIKVDGESIKGGIDYYTVSYYIPTNLDTIQAQEIFQNHFTPLQISNREEVPQYITIAADTDPSGLSFYADGVEYTAPFSFTWLVGSTHTLSVDSIQGENMGSRYIFQDWSDGGAMAHGIVVSTDPLNIVGRYKTQNFLAIAASPEGAGNVIPLSPGLWADENTVVFVEAIPSTWYAFLNWSGDLTGVNNPDSLLLESPKVVTAHFGNYPPVVHVPDTTFAEDDTLIIDFGQILQWIEDGNNPDSTLSVFMNGGNQLEVKKDTLKNQFIIFNKQMHWNGIDTLSVTVSDPLNASDHDDMAVAVSPVPDPPGPFSLTDPADGLSIAEWPDAVDFSWDPAIDPDEGDVVRYLFEFDSTAQFSSGRLIRVEDLEITSYTFPWPDSYGDGSYYWRVQAMDMSGHTTGSDQAFVLELETGNIGGIPRGIPTTYVLAQNFPNPFNHDTTIRFGLPDLSHVSLIIYDSQGRRVKIISEGEWKKGYHSLLWDGRDERGTQVSSGLYFILFQGDTFQFVKKAILLR